MLRMANTPTPGTFFVAIWEAWGTRMSGIISVPLTALAVFNPAWDLRWLWIILALGATGYTIYGIWARERSRVIELEEGQKPHFSVACGDDVPDSMSRNNIRMLVLEPGRLFSPKIPRGVDFFGVVVRNTGTTPIEKCHADLVRLEKNGSLKSRRKSTLSFGPRGRTE
jgi:hypothetical protein